MGIHWTGMSLGLGFVISLDIGQTDFWWCTRVKRARSAFGQDGAGHGAAFKMAVAFIVILPGLLGLAVFLEKLVGDRRRLLPALTATMKSCR